jgi:hypothetical protein
MSQSNKFSYFTSGKFRSDVYPKKLAFKAYNLSRLSKVIATYRNKQTHLEDFYELQNSSFETESCRDDTFYYSDDDNFTYLSENSQTCPCCEKYEEDD